MLKTEDFWALCGVGHHSFHKRVLDCVNQATGMDIKFGHRRDDAEWADHESAWGLHDYEKIDKRHALIFSCPITDKLELQLRDMVRACVRYCASEVTAILSFTRYRRQDHSEFFHELPRLQFFVHDMAAWGVNRIIACDLHSVEHTQKFCDEAGIELINVDPTECFANAIMPTIQEVGQENVRIYSPDFGSVKRSIALARATGTKVLATPKDRLTGDTVNFDKDFDPAEFLKKIHEFYGDKVPVECDITDLSGLYIFMREDEIETGNTSKEAGVIIKKAGALGLYFVVTHPVCTPGWMRKLKIYYDEEKPFDKIWFGNTRLRGHEHSTYEESTGMINEVDISPAICSSLIDVLEQNDPDKIEHTVMGSMLKFPQD